MSFFCFFMQGCENRRPSVVLEDLQGHSYTFPDPQGRWVLINYWASWCKPCYEEAPALNKFYKRHRDKVLLLGVNFDEVSPVETKKLCEKLNIHFPILNGNPAEKLQFETVPGLPTTVVFNPKGQRVAMLAGAQTLKQLENAVNIH